MCVICYEDLEVHLSTSHLPLFGIQSDTSCQPLSKLCTAAFEVQFVCLQMVYLVMSERFDMWLFFKNLHVTTGSSLFLSALVLN